MDSDDVLARLSALDTSTVSDALDRLGLPGAVPGILPLSIQFRVCGPAFTVAYEAVDAVGGTVGDFIDDVAPGSVVLIDNRQRTDCTVWGDIMTTVGSKRELGGTVIDGVCRDVSRSLELGYPVFSRGRSMRTGKDRVRLAGVQVSVQFGGFTVRPGDYVLADADGVVVFSESAAGRVLEVAGQIGRAEDNIRSAVLGGSRLDDSRRLHGYHSLQTRHSGISQ